MYAPPKRPVARVSIKQSVQCVKTKKSISNQLSLKVLKSIISHSYTHIGAPCPNRDNLAEIEGCWNDQEGTLRTKICNNSIDKEQPYVNCKHPGVGSEDGTVMEVMLCDVCGGNGSHVDCDEGLKALWDQEQKTGVRLKSHEWSFVCLGNYCFSNKLFNII